MPTALIMLISLVVLIAGAYATYKAAVSGKQGQPSMGKGIAFLLGGMGVVLMIGSMFGLGAVQLKDGALTTGALFALGLEGEEETETELCGNGICDAGENSVNCPGDCPSDGGVVCGNGVCETGENSVNCAGDCQEPPGNRVQLIKTFQIQIKNKRAGTWNSIGNSSAGSLRIYEATADPRDPTVNALNDINVSSGVGSKDDTRLTTDTDYRVVFDGDNIWNVKDYGVMKFAWENYQKQTGEYLFKDGEGVTKTAIIDDFLDETSGSLNDTNVNGQASTGVADGLELQHSAADTLTYDESVGDGQWYVIITPSFSGAYSELTSPVFCFKYDIDNPPESNEVDQILRQHQSGTDFFPAGLNDLTAYWTSQSCVPLGPAAVGGSSGKEKLTFTYDEDALDTNDDWYMYVDDLGSVDGTDILLQSGARYDRLKLDAQA